MTPFEEMLDKSPVAAGWKMVQPKPHHGIAIPLGALHSEHSCGIGEYADLLPLIEWCKTAGFDVIQLLPLNDSGVDPSPYNALSSCALHPIYLSLHLLPELDQQSTLVDQFISLRALSQLPRISYTEVLTGKLQWLRTYYNATKEKLLSNSDFQNFKSANPWVETYALFKALKDHFQQSAWETWPPEYRTPDAYQRTDWIGQYNDDISFYTALQFFCFEQLKTVHAYAEKNNFFLMGDIPILLSRDSADVWHAPQFFVLDLAAGAPPDAYNQEGQYWGFPLFQWEVMRQDDYRFWRERLHTATQFYHIYRIDHVVGFFRIWGIHLGHSAREGSFYPSEADQWIPQGRHLLSMMFASSPMLPIGEDLGSVPHEVRTCLEELCVCGTKVMRWERLWDETGALIPLDHYPLLSMTCISTHDSETLALWWRDCPEEAKQLASVKHWSYQPELTLEQRLSLLHDSHRTSSIFHINPLQEYLALYSELVAEDPTQERINIPGTLSPSNWTYRFRPSIETLLKHATLQTTLRQLLQKSP